VQLVVEAHDRARTVQGRVDDGRERRGEVAGTVGRQVGGRPHRAGQHDARAIRGGTREQVHQERRVLQGVRTVRDDHAVVALLGDCPPGTAREGQHGRRFQVPARLGEHVLDDDVRGYRVGRQGGEQLGTGRERAPARPRPEPDRAAGSQQEHPHASIIL
jgi:hypothetical protein